MALDPVRENLDGLPEAIAEEYQQYQGDDPGLKGKYVLSISSAGGLTLENVGGLKRALENEKGTRRRLREQLDRFVDGEGNPLDPTVVLEALDELTRHKSKKPPEKDPNGKADPPEGFITRDQLSEREKRWTGEKKKLELERDGARAELRKYVIETKAMEAIVKHDGIPRALMPHVLQACDLKEVNGKPAVVILNDSGEPRISQRSGNTGNMDLDEFVGEILKADQDFRGNFKGTDASGGGMDAPGAHPPGARQIDPKLPATERLKQAREAQQRSGS